MGEAFKYLKTKCLCIIAAMMAVPCVAEASDGNSAIKGSMAQGQATGVIILFGVLIAAFAIMGGIMFARKEKETGKLMMLGASVSSVAVMVLVKILYFA